MFLAFIVAGFGLLFLAHTAPFPFLLDLIAPAPAVWDMPGRPSGPMVYLTFDDGPNPTATPDILDVLMEHRAVATFFVIDRHLTDETVSIARRAVSEGHAIGLHTHTRALMMMSPQVIARTLTAAAARIEVATGRRPCPVFRPHGGWRSSQMYEGLALIGPCAGWMGLGVVGLQLVSDARIQTPWLPGSNGRFRTVTSSSYTTATTLIRGPIVATPSRRRPYSCQPCASVGSVLASCATRPELLVAMVVITVPRESASPAACGHRSKWR